MKFILVNVGDLFDELGELKTWSLIRETVSAFDEHLSARGAASV